MYSNPPAIHWAPLPASPAPSLSKRLFKLTNGAPFHIQIKWKIYKVVELDGVQEAPRPADDAEDEVDCPYTVSPKQTVCINCSKIPALLLHVCITPMLQLIKAHQTQDFLVQLLCKQVGVYHYR